MKKLWFPIPLVFLMLTPLFLQAQSPYLKDISAFDNNYDNSSGIIAISDTAVFEYSWYYDRWLPFPDSGLVKYDGIPVVTDLASFDNDSHNPSGIYIISDTVVCVYNYYSGKWHSLSNDGLAQIDGVVQLSSISAYKEADTGDVKLHVVSDTSVYRYEWYYEVWYRFPNDGLISKTTAGNSGKNPNMAVYPNPFSSHTNISYDLPAHYKGNISIALYDKQGRLVREVINTHQTGGYHQIKLDAYDLPAGMYYYEICGDDFSQAKKAICIK
ncbi:MAG: T9SS type A sorting domain-containing protein [Candidatus Delongbacteria bacterium]|jgi:hypothetical protein|nr:T9SS type A sorting domain-containing protein [Candidatus Delongbacteria bacterium]